GVLRLRLDRRRLIEIFVRQFRTDLRRLANQIEAHQYRLRLALRKDFGIFWTEDVPIGLRHHAEAALITADVDFIKKLLRPDPPLTAVAPGAPLGHLV